MGISFVLCLTHRLKKLSLFLSSSRRGDEVERAEPAHFTSEATPMSRLFRIQIDQDLLGRIWNTRIRRRFRLPPFGTIDGGGFIADGNNWIVREKDLGYLKPAEVKSAEVVASGERGV